MLQEWVSVSSWSSSSSERIFGDLWFYWRLLMSQSILLFSFASCIPCVWWYPLFSDVWSPQESVRQKENTRFYLQTKDEVYCSNVAIFVGNLAPNQSQRQYEKSLVDLLGKRKYIKLILSLTTFYASSCLVTKTHQVIDDDPREHWLLNEFEDRRMKCETSFWFWHFVTKFTFCLFCTLTWSLRYYHYSHRNHSHRHDVWSIHHMTSQHINSGK